MWTSVYTHDKQMNIATETQQNRETSGLYDHSINFSYMKKNSLISWNEIPYCDTSMVMKGTKDISMAKDSYS